MGSAQGSYQRAASCRILLSAAWSPTETHRTAVREVVAIIGTDPVDAVTPDLILFSCGAHVKLKCCSTEKTDRITDPST